MKVFAIFLLFLSANAFAAFKTGNDLIQLKKASDATSPTRYQNQADIYGYIGGVVDATAGQGWYCLPGTVTLGQAEAVVFKYLDENPQYWHLDGAALIQGALYSRFPCATKK